MKKKNIKEFVKDHKKAVIGTIVGIGGIAIGTVVYKIGLRNGELQGIGKSMAMIYADLDGTAMIVEHCLDDRFTEDEMKTYIAFGNEMVQNGLKNMELA